MDEPTIIAWQDEADDVARWAHDEKPPLVRDCEGSSRLPHVLCFYDNAPHRDDGVRATQHLHLKAALNSKGIATLAEASYPEFGEDAGYTVAIIFDTSNCAGGVTGAADEVRRLLGLPLFAAGGEPESSAPE